MQLALLLLIVTEPEPVRVTLPLILSWVGLFPEFSWIVPLLVIVPWRIVVLLSLTLYVPRFVTPFSVAVCPPRLSMTPPVPVVRVPPVMATPFSRTTVEFVPTAVMVPPVLVTFPPLTPVNTRVLPLVASSVPVFVVPPLVWITKAFWPLPAFASMVPELLNVSWPSPILPAPWMVSRLVKRLLPAVPTMKLAALLPIVSVPPPLKVTEDEPIISCVGLLPEFSEILPAFEMLPPSTVSEWLSLIARESSESIVRLLIAVFMSNVTMEVSAFP